jgi:hypothetical protein
VPAGRRASLAPGGERKFQRGLLAWIRACRACAGSRSRERRLPSHGRQAQAGCAISGSVRTENRSVLRDVVGRIAGSQ